MSRKIHVKLGLKNMCFLRIIATKEMLNNSHTDRKDGLRSSLDDHTPCRLQDLEGKIPLRRHPEDTLLAEGPRKLSHHVELCRHLETAVAKILEPKVLC